MDTVHGGTEQDNYYYYYYTGAEEPKNEKTRWVYLSLLFFPLMAFCLVLQQKIKSCLTIRCTNVIFVFSPPNQ